MFRLCVIVPTYNNVSTLEEMIRQLLTFGHPVVIVDDGSENETAGLVEALSAQYPSVHRIRRSVNGGKGAAVMDGLTWAGENGFSHALQIDADNQHRVADVKVFVDAAEGSPDALILGRPVFSEQTPRGRRIGRQISVVWVAIETLSGAISDPLFGFRVYPVAAALTVIRKSRIGCRMDFDPEIAVRLYWSGLDVVNIDTPVVYPPGGVSSFRMFRDNVRITWMHTRLFVGMLVRCGTLIGRHIRR